MTSESAPTPACSVLAGEKGAGKEVRLKSLDALRGFDMLWIIGLDALFRGLAGLTESPALDWIGEQVHHAHWEGLHLYDLIFPLFVFLSGVALPYALHAKRERGDSPLKWCGLIGKRVLLLVVLGMVYNGMLQFQWESLRMASVLGLIGISYGVAAVFFVVGRSPWWRILGALAILFGVAYLQLFFPVPDHGAGELTPVGIVNSWLDRTWLPGRLYLTWYDPEGLLCIVSAAFLALVGCLAGELLHHRSKPHLRTVFEFVLIGGVLFGLGWLCWELGYPPIKGAWTSSFNLLAGGIAFGLLAVFHLSIDFIPRFNWSLPLQIVGMNPLTIYLLHHIVPFDRISWFFFGGVAKLSGEWGGVVLVAGMIVLQWLLLLLFYRKKIFLRG